MLTYELKPDTIDDPILQHPSQDQSTSYKYGCVLDAHLFMLGRIKFIYNSRITVLRLVKHYKYDP